MTDKGIHLVKTYMLKANMTDNTMFVMQGPIGGRRENFWGISCEKSRFYAKKSCFSIAEVGAKLLRYFVCKITILRQF